MGNIIFNVRERTQGKTAFEQAKIVQMQLLNVFVAICAKYQLSYWLDYGTLLGAVRHGGYIPWDDDIDVSMLESDYKKFLKIVSSELPEGVIVENMAKNPKSLFSFLKLRDCYSLYCEDLTDVRSPSGIFIDIFQVGRVPNLPQSVVNFICWLEYTGLRHAALSLSKIRSSVILKIMDCIRCACYKSLALFARYAYRGLAALVPSMFLRSVGGVEGKREFIHKNDIFPLSSHEFETGTYAVPRNFEKVLASEYGEWRKLPPVEKRYFHATVISPTLAPTVWWAKKWE